MKANEFVKTHGLESTKDIVKHYGNHTHVTDDARMFVTEKFYKETRANYADDLNSMVKIADLKRIVESHELVKDLYGLAKAKEYASSPYTAPELVERVKQAIADVESCL